MTRVRRRSSSRSWPSAALLVLAGVGVLAGCRERTEIVVRIDSDLVVPSDMDGLEVRIEGESVSSFSVPLGDVASAGVYTLPATVALLPHKADDEQFLVSVAGLVGDLEVVRQDAKSGFVAGKVRQLDVFLAQACRNVSCGVMEETCSHGACTNRWHPPELLPPYGRGTADAGSD